MTFNDIFKSSFLENVSAFSVTDTLVALLFSFLTGILIFQVYKKTYNGVMYSGSFGVSLITMSMITSLVILAISSNVVLSLGMVGALSIVRFRTAVKDPLDIAYLFWAISEGIVMGAGMIPLGIIGALVVAAILLGFSGRQCRDKSYILVLNCESEEAEQNAARLAAEETKKCLVKSKTVSADNIELTMEVRLPKENETEFVNRAAGIIGVRDAVLVSYNGEFMS
ncbi:MAG: DUF4956 domain-containing protein [Firmicutes bacterium]|nr:DUF4956 domain-containing protein [Bacillota bacterium]